MYEDVLKVYSIAEIVQICKYLNKEYNANPSSPG